MNGWLLEGLLGQMRASLFQFALLLLAGLLCGCGSDEPRRPAVSEPPAIIMTQYPDLPMPGRGSDFPGGLVAALWCDGRVIRPVRPDAIGKSYVEGATSSAEREAFFVFLNASAATRISEGGGIPVDAATEFITISRDGKMSRWTRILPDMQSPWCEVESRLMSLPLHNRHNVEWEAIRDASWDK
jgi:hypothetical protein